MKNYLLPIGLFLMAVILAGCIGGATQPVCNEPYILVGTSCCLDQNDNGICDSEEAAPAAEEPEEAEEEAGAEEAEELQGTECTTHSDCDDGNSCTTDGCVDGVCKHTQNLDCPTPTLIDVEAYIAKVHCDETDGEEEGHFLLNNEWVLLHGQGVVLTGWTLEDSNGNVFEFPNGFELKGELYVHTGHGIMTAIDLYQLSSEEIWEANDMATLKNPAGDVVSQKACS